MIPRLQALGIQFVLVQDLVGKDGHVSFSRKSGEKENHEYCDFDRSAYSWARLTASRYAEALRLVRRIWPRRDGRLLRVLGFRPGKMFALMAGLGETAGGLLILLGLGGALGPVLIVLVMLVAIGAVHFTKGFFVTNGGWELNARIYRHCTRGCIRGYWDSTRWTTCSTSQFLTDHTQIWYALAAAAVIAATSISSCGGPPRRRRNAAWRPSPSMVPECSAPRWFAGCCAAALRCAFGTARPRAQALERTAHERSTIRSRRRRRAAGSPLSERRRERRQRPE